jgi:hypothetical protein
MSALCHKRTFCAAAQTALFNHLVGTSNERLRQVETDCSCSLEIDDQLKLGGFLNRQITGLLALEYAIDVGGRQPELFDLSQTTGGNVVSVIMDRRQPVPCCKHNNAL